MAVVPTNLELIMNVCTSANNKQLLITESTGAYHPQSNPTGWAPAVTATNPATIDVTNIQLLVTNPNGVVKTYTLAPGPETLSGVFPDPSGQNVLYVDNSAFGGSPSDILPNGSYEVSYKVEGDFTGGNTFSTTTTARVYNASDLVCCRDKLFAAAGACDGCRDEKLNLALEVDAYIKAAEFASACENNNSKATKFTNKALWICNSHGCLNCS